MTTNPSGAEFIVPPEWREEWSHELARPLEVAAAADAVAMLVFRLGAEWFALPAAVIAELSRVPVIHRLPSRSAVGVINFRGRITVCAGLDPLLQPLGETTATDPRLLVIQAEGWLFATRVDAVDGVHRLDRRELSPPPPPNVSRFTTGLWTLADRSVAHLDHRRLFAAVKDSLA